MALLSLVQNKNKLYYCEVKGIEKELTSGLKIVFDFGEKHQSFVENLLFCFTTLR